VSLRIAFLMPGIGVVERGAEVFVLELSRALAGHGHEVTIFSRGPASDGRERIRALARDTGWINRIYGATRMGRKVLDTAFLDPLNLEWSTAALSALPRLWSGRFDLAVIEGGVVGGWAGKFLRRFRGLPFVDIAHGNSVKWETAFARARPDRVVTFTHAQAETIGARVPRAAVTVIPHGVDLGAFETASEPRKLDLERPVILCAGSVDRQKRLDLAVEAVAGLEQGSLAVLGDGPEAVAVDRLAAERLGPGRYLRRRVSRSQMPEWYSAADLFTLPSESEAFGLVYLEAAACGLASVCPGDAVRREVLGDAAVFADVENQPDYTRALEQALEQDWGAGPRRRAERFPFSATVEGYARLFDELCKRSGPDPS